MHDSAFVFVEIVDDVPVACNTKCEFPEFLRRERVRRTVQTECHFGGGIVGEPHCVTLLERDGAGLKTIVSVGNKSIEALGCVERLDGRGSSNCWAGCCPGADLFAERGGAPAVEVA